MLNIISFLIIIIASLIGIKNNNIPNQLFNLGLLILIAYILSILARFLKIPLIFGYILAGILAGYNGLGLVNKSFIGEMSLIEGIFFMILISNAARFICKEQSPKFFSRYFLIGVLSSLVTFILTLGFFAPLSIPLETKIIMGLFSATFSPLMVYSFTEDNETAKPYIQLSFGGYFFVLILWGFLTAFFGPASLQKVKIASMPIAIALLSVIAGVVWGYIAEKLLYPEAKKLRSLYPLAIMFLSYPLINELGFDFLFFAFGIGAYNGIFSGREKTIIECSEFSALIVFGLFGMHLSLDDFFLIGSANWSLVAILITFFIFTRIISTRLSLHLIPHETKIFPSIIYFIPCGPMTLILLRRFMPGFQTALSGEIDLLKMYSILTTSMMLIIMIFLILYLIRIRPFWKQDRI